MIIVKVGNFSGLFKGTSLSSVFTPTLAWFFSQSSSFPPLTLAISFLIQEKTSSVVSEVNKTVFFFYKTYFKPKIHKTIASN